MNVLEAARQAGARRVVNTSTGGAIYGEGRTIPAPEDHPVAPEAPYGLSKFCAENYCDLFTRFHGLSTVSLRYGNVYGPRQDPLGEAGVVAIFCGKLLEGGRPTVFGDGLQTRDYVYVGDVVSANLLAADSDTTGAINIGTGVETTVLDIVEALAGQADGASFEAEMAPERPGEVRHIALDAGRAQSDLGWRAEVGICRRSAAHARARCAELLAARSPRPCRRRARTPRRDRARTPRARDAGAAGPTSGRAPLAPPPGARGARGPCPPPSPSFCRRCSSATSSSMWS